MSFLADRQTFGQKIISLNWILIALVCCIGAVGVMALYSAAGGAFDPWASNHMIRFALGLVLMIGIGLTDMRFWYQMSWPIYIVGVFLLLYVSLFGHTGMGAQRWIDLKFIKLQPSEAMKVALILIYARWFGNTRSDQVQGILYYAIPVILVCIPVAMIYMQPDLGTSLMVLALAFGMLFAAGLSVWVFITGGVAAAIAIPMAWQFVLKDYQKRRVMTFLDPESDPLGAGYHITQSKIALGSGGIEGKGFLKGTQSTLDFLPEKHTDFIFTLWAEEWGLTGGLFILMLFALVFAYLLWLLTDIKHDFGRLIVIGASINLSLYMFINIGMVMGLLPVVGAPLPLVSYGGTSMLAVMIAFGLVISASLYKGDRV